MALLEGKTALVTGGTTGIGLAAAQRLAAEGAQVFLTGRRKPELDEAVAAVGHGAVGIAGDVSDLADLDALFDAIERNGKGLDVLFANAGGGEFAPLEAVTPEHVAQTFGINVNGTIFTVQKALRVLNDGASVILTGSTAATSGMASFGVYAATKAAIRSFGRTWAAELAPRRIRVNTVIPGPVRTPGLTGLAPDEASVDGLLQSLAGMVPMGRVADPSEIASAVAFLASSESSFMTGGEIFVDGGQKQL